MTSKELRRKYRYRRKEITSLEMYLIMLNVKFIIRFSISKLKKLTWYYIVYLAIVCVIMWWKDMRPFNIHDYAMILVIYLGIIFVPSFLMYWFLSSRYVFDTENIYIANNGSHVLAKWAVNNDKSIENVRGLLDFFKKLTSDKILMNNFFRDFTTPGDISMVNKYKLLLYDKDKAA